MNENSCLNEAIFIFAVQSCFSKNLNFLTQTHGSKMVVKPTWVWHSCQAHDPWVWQLCKTLRYMGMANLSELANNKQIGQLCTLVVMRKKRKKKTQKIDHQWQSNHYLSTRATSCEKGHGCASS
jgi:hypothetical protein